MNQVKKMGRPPKPNKEVLANFTIKVPVAKRDQLNKWLNERGLKLTPWFKMIVKKETGIEL